MDFEQSNTNNFQAKFEDFQNGGLAFVFVKQDRNLL